jgi:hypothetical protein
MNDHVKLRYAEIRLRLHDLDRLLEQAQTGPLGISEGVRKRAENRMDEMGEVIALSVRSVDVAYAKVATWVDTGRDNANASAGVSAFDPSGPTASLNQRADDVEAYALAVLELAAAACRECAHAILEAVLARSDADRSGLRFRPEAGGPAIGKAVQG